MYEQMGTQNGKSKQQQCGIREQPPGERPTRAE